MIYDWYFVFNLDEFIATGLVSKSVQLKFPSTGLETILITQGNLVSILFRDVFLSLDLNDKNPFEFDGFAVATNDDGDICIGIPSEN